jgi:hypothetical protein
VADAIMMELRGIPAASICTDALRPAADAMASIQGMPGYRYAVVGHPVSSQGPEELAATAEVAVPQVLQILRGPSGS